jgi:hypothetical protein
LKRGAGREEDNGAMVAEQEAKAEEVEVDDEVEK